jgi:hypothetical protein
MSQKTKLEMVNSRFGRIALHIFSMIRDHKFKWHSKFIIRAIILKS